jgi:hypothetical protein
MIMPPPITPQGHQNQRRFGPGLALQPERTGHPTQRQGPVQQAEFGIENPHPQNGNRDHVGHRGQEKDRAKKLLSLEI